MNNYNKKSEQTNTSKQVDQSMIRKILMVMFGLIETMLGFRFVFKLAGANPENVLIRILYDVTDNIVGVFANIFTAPTTDGLETVSIFEPGTLIAMVVIALIAIALQKLMPNDTQVQKFTTQHSNTTGNNINHTNDHPKPSDQRDATNSTPHATHDDKGNSN